MEGKCVMNKAISLEEFSVLQSAIIDCSGQYPALDHRRTVKYISPVLDIQAGGITKINLRGVGWFQEFRVEPAEGSPAPSLSKRIMHFLNEH